MPREFGSSEMARCQAPCTRSARSCRASGVPTSWTASTSGLMLLTAPGQGSELGLVGGVVRRPELGARPVQGLDVPGGDDHGGEAKASRSPATRGGIAHAGRTSRGPHPRGLTEREGDCSDRRGTTAPIDGSALHVSAITTPNRDPWRRESLIGADVPAHRDRHQADDEPGTASGHAWSFVQASERGCRRPAGARLRDGVVRESSGAASR
jgi:hypothetical protein